MAGWRRGACKRDRVWGWIHLFTEWLLNKLLLGAEQLGKLQTPKDESQEKETPETVKSTHKYNSPTFWKCWRRKILVRSFAFP